MIKAIIIGLAIIWALLITVLSFTAILVGYRNDTEIKNLESWKILSQIKIPKDDGKGGAE